LGLAMRLPALARSLPILTDVTTRIRERIERKTDIDG